VKRPAALVLILLLAAPAWTNSPGEVPIGGTLREATLAGLNGPSRALSVYRGKPLIINVWASWCAPCREEMQSLERLAWRDGSRGIAIIGISTDDVPDKAKSFLGAAHATISHFIDSGLAMETMLGATRLPLTVLIGADGRIVQKIYGAREWDSEDSKRLIEAAFRRAQ
jgi:thiol-disulfide isomerase/thioredoxin